MTRSIGHVIAELVAADAPNLASHREIFMELSGLATSGRHDPDTTAFLVQLAADFGWLSHPGKFVDDSLEVAISMHPDGSMRRSRPVAIGGHPQSRPRPNAERVLHVLTEAFETGGHSRLAWRWIDADRGRVHSVVFTASAQGSGAARLASAARATGGAAYECGTGGITERGLDLRAIAIEHDVIVLHVQPYDCLPIVAFANWNGRTPIILVNHADHTFWIGRSIADIVVCLRDSGARLAERRRGIPADRIAILPVPVHAEPPTMMVADARQRLGVMNGNRLAISIGSPYKFGPLRGLDFAEVAQDLVRQTPALVVRVVGPEPTGRWEAAARTTSGRVAALGLRKDLADIHAAADLYLDPFPFSSLTAFLEAGLTGLPILSLHPYPADAEVLSGDSPGLQSLIPNPPSIERLATDVGAAVADDDRRHVLGARTAAAIAAINAGPGWTAALEGAYAKARHAGPRVPVPAPDSEGTALDGLLVDLHAAFGGLARAVSAQLPRAPMGARLRIAGHLARRRRVVGAASLLSPSVRRRLRS